MNAGKFGKTVLPLLLSASLFALPSPGERPFPLRFAKPLCETAAITRDSLCQSVVRRYSGVAPGKFAEFVPGVKRRLATGEKVVALTFDLCGSAKKEGKGNGFDREMFEFLKRNGIPATVFASGRWIDANPGIFRELAACPLIEIENHGMRHKPASVSGAIAHGATGTASPAELVDEVEMNARKIESLTGRAPMRYRSGTAYYDETSVAIIAALGFEAVNFSVLSGDAEKGAGKAEVEANILHGARPGAIIIMHMNRPEWQGAEALEGAVKGLLGQGYGFVRLDGFRLE
ncbi:MAG: polysaccharide deacetylase family protein [Candidatus Micrarchaeia archaeon]